MKFIEILRGLGPDHIVPERLLNDLLAIQSQSDLDEALALLLSEIISPGSQQLTNNINEITALTPPSIPEASARGSQLGSIIRKLPRHPTWNQVFSIINQKLPSPSISQASLSQLLSALDDSTIDAFLQFDWSQDFQIHLFIALRQLNPQNGSFDLLRTNYLKTIVNEPELSNVKSSILFYANVTRLELNCIANSAQIENLDFKKFLHQVFEEDIRSAPELIALGCVQFTPQSQTIDDLLENLIVHLLDESTPYYLLVLKNLRNTQLLFKIITKLVQTKGNLHTNTLSYLEQNHLVEEYLTHVEFESGLLFAVQVVRVGWVGFGKFLNNNKRVDSLLEFLKLQSVVDQDSKKDKNVSLKAIYILLEFIQKQKLTESQFVQFQIVQTQCLQAFPRLINFGFGHDEAILANGDKNQFPLDVESQMKVFYQKMYNNEIEIKDVISMLSALRDSDQPRDQDVFACMIHSLLDEYRFFPEYPLNALAITSVLFGSMIYFQLIRGNALTIALRYILDSCNQPADSNMFKFSVQALYAFRHRLPEFPNYCAALTEIESLKSQPQVYQIILDAVNNKSGVTQGDIALNQAQAQAQQQNQLQNRTVEPRAKSLRAIFTKLPIPNDVPQENPTNDVSKRILFLVNNLSDDNLASKIEEIKTKVTPSIYGWLANFLVVQRAKQEPNNHHLYGAVVLAVDDELLVDHVINVTAEEVDDLLNDFEETPTQRSFLKNLGSWLGRITLARNIPLKHRTIALKELLMEAYDKNKLSLVIPFISKVLHQTKDSEVFKYPNPWTLGILKVLVELYQFASLKLNLKFEIEVLFNHLKLSLDEIEADTVIRKHDSNELQAQLEAGITNLRLESNSSSVVLPQQLGGLANQVQDQLSLFNQGQQPQPQQSAVGTPTLAHQQHQHQAHQQPIASQSQAQQANEGPFQNLRGSTAFVTHPNLKRMFVMALTKSVREILPPAVERSVTIAVTTARSLVLKDFATEVDEVKLRTAAYNIVRRLAETLALATCRDPLKENIQTTVHGFAPQLMNVENSPFEELPQAINDNIDLACGIIEKAAMEKSVQEIDEVLVGAINVRRMHKERRPEHPFFSQSFSRYSASLPEPLGLKPSGVTPHQFQVYESFGKNTMPSPGQFNTSPPEPQQLNPSLIGNVLPSQQQVPPQQQQQQQPQPQQQTQLLQPQQPPPQLPSQPTQTHGFQRPISIEQTFSYAQGLVESLLKSVTESTAGRLKDLDSESPTRILLGQIFNVIAKNLTREPLVLKLTQFIVNALFTTSDSDLAVEVFVFLLDKICEISPATKKDVVWWLIHITDDRKFNLKVLLSLFTVQIMQPSEFDDPLSKFVCAENDSTVEFACNLIEESLKSKDFVAYHADFVTTVDTLRSLKDNMRAATFVESLEDLKVSILRDIVGEEVSAVDRFGYVFTEWIRLLQHKPNDSRLHLTYIYQLLESGILNDAEAITLFFRTSVDIAINYFKQGETINDGFLGTDALSKLIVLLLINHDDSDDAKNNYFKLVMSIISLVFADDHEKSKESFNERPYFRIFSTLLSEWSSVATAEEEFNAQFYLTLADFFNAYQPLAFPGFSFAWITLVSHRLFLPKILDLDHPKAQGKFILLVLDLLRFENKYIKGKEIPEVISVVYKGTSRLFLLLLHDYPEVLVQHHHQLTCEIPPSFVQLRNIVLSAFPKSITMPDPFTQGLKVDRLTEISEAPIVAYGPQNDLKGLKKSIDSYLRVPSQVLLKTILNGLKQSPTLESGIGYSKSNFNTKLINGLVLYVGIQAVNERPSNGPTFNPKSSHYSLLAGLVQEGSIEFQYHLIEAISNQLRYPNSHTHWFSYLILHFFGASSLWNGEKLQVQQVITRVLLERVICNRPHPWGLLITFTELLKNTELAFFDLSFIKQSPEIERMFESLLRHISSTSGSAVSAAAPSSSGSVISQSKPSTPVW